MNDFQISIIVISFNNFKYIFKAIASILSQTYSNIQLIISDDGSSDFDEKRLRRYLKKNIRKNITDIIINVNKNNIGTVKHLEMLYPKCTGELITILAADDAFADANVFRDFANEYLRYNKQVGVITSLLAMCDTKLKKVNSIFTNEQDIALINSGDSRRLFEELAYRCIMPSSGTVITPEVHRLIGTLSDNYNYVEDWNSHLRIARMGLPVKCLNRVTVLHRDGGVSHGNKRVNYDVFLKYYKDLLTLYELEVLPYEQQLSGFAARRARQYYNWRNKRYQQDSNNFLVSNNRKKIVFYFRKGVIAKGDFALYYCIAAQLAMNEKYAVYCVNNSIKELQEKYLDSGIIFCDITPQNIYMFEGATFVTAFNQMFFLLDEISKLENAKILLLFLHPQIYSWMANQVSPKFNFNSLFKLLLKNNSYAFMDKGNLLAIQRHSKFKFEPRYFPVVTNVNQEKAYARKKDPNYLNIVWFGRLDGDKIYSLLNFLDNIIDFDFGKPLTVHLIGDGNAKNLIKFDKYAPQIRFIFNSFLYGEEKDRYMKENADMVVAMGISALDAALLKIPTILPIVSPKAFKDNKFTLFYDLKEYCLGVAANDIKETNVKTYPAHKIIEMCSKDYVDIGEKCYSCAISNFDVLNQIDKIENDIITATMDKRSCLRNMSVASQMVKFKIYKLLRGQRTYNDYLIFKQKLRKFWGKSIKEKIKTIRNKLLKRYGNE